MSYQQVIIVGTIGKNLELSQTKGGLSYCKFSVATSKKVKEKETTSWHKMTAWGKTAEYLEKNAQKGSKVFVEGELNYGDYEKNGVKHYTTDIFVNRIEIISAKQSGSKPEKEALVSSSQPIYDDSEVPF